jgi:hypothetical protein
LERPALRDPTTILDARAVACGVLAWLGATAGAMTGLSIADAMYPGTVGQIARGHMTIVLHTVPPPARSPARDTTRAGSEPEHRARKPRRRPARGARAPARATIASAPAAPAVTPSARRVPVRAARAAAPAPRPSATFDDSG